MESNVIIYVTNFSESYPHYQQNYSDRTFNSSYYSGDEHSISSETERPSVSNGNENSGPGFYYYNPPPSDTDKFHAKILMWCNFFLVGPLPVLVSGFGVFSNIINLLVFYRQGILSDSITASLASLALSDFGLCILTLVYSFSFFLADLAYYFKVSVNRETCMDITVALLKPMPLFVKTTSWITVYVALERMVSVTFPFHVKLIFNAKRSCGVISIILITSAMIDVPSYFPYYSPYGPGEDLLITKLQTASSYINSYVLRLAAILAVLILNIIIVAKVIISKKFRNKSKMAKKVNRSTHDQKLKASGEKKEAKKDKELKLVVMVTVLSIMFLVCYSVYAFYGLITDVVLIDFSSWNIIDVLNLFKNTGKLLEVVNSSANIIVYYTMSTKYKNDLRTIFECLKKKP